MMHLVHAYLTRLGLTAEGPTLPYLDRIVKAHQERIGFETFTKILDYERREEYGGHLPPVEQHVARIAAHGIGGTCWTQARSLHWLLTALGFAAGLVYMEPGHLCVRIEIDGRPYYADVGYGAPLFRAYPMDESFRVEAPSETFDYRVDGPDQVTVVRTPGPTKVLSMKVRQMSEFTAHIAAANQWDGSKFLKLLSITKYPTGALVRLTGNELTDFRSGEGRVVTLDDAGITCVLEEVFEVDADLYFAARTVQRRFIS